MALITVGDVPLLGGTLCLPRIGVWHMDAVLDTADQLSGAVKVVLSDSLTLSGTIFAGGPYTETGYYRILGGAAAMNKTAKAKGYGQCQLRVPLKDLLEGVGEKLASSADQAVLGVQLPGWATLGVVAGRQLAALLGAAPAGTAWRLTNEGEIWVGAETWPDFSGDAIELGELPHEGRMEVTTEEAIILPGTTVLGKRIGYVEHRIDAGKLRTLLLVEAAS